MRILAHAVFHDLAMLRLGGHACQPSLLFGGVGLMVGKTFRAGIGMLLLNFERAPEAVAIVAALLPRCMRAGFLGESAGDKQGRNEKKV